MVELSIGMKALQASLGYQFIRPDLLELALTHKSFANERVSGSTTVGLDNERLEFLGDAVLDLALSECLMRRFAADPEGALSKKRASLVNEETLSRLALQLKIDALLRLGKGEIKTGGLNKPRILASSLEAVLGAVLLDGGYNVAQAAIEVLFRARLDELGNSDVDFKDDFKSRLQERMQELHRATPLYKVEGESGPDHDKQFAVSVRLNDRVLATGSGKSKKSAEQDAARQALELGVPHSISPVIGILSTPESQPTEMKNENVNGSENEA